MKEKRQATNALEPPFQENEPACRYEEFEEPRRSPLADSLARLRDASMGAADRRGRLPQPLFWSLFHSEISRLKRIKARRRLLDSLFGDDPAG